MLNTPMHSNKCSDQLMYFTIARSVLRLQIGGDMNRSTSISNDSVNADKKQTLMFSNMESVRLPTQSYILISFVLSQRASLY